ncbi:hypothetical protein JD969_20460 [Planctomycetota bacterium]|nr:hypothetical protein JD969_20460 [Planctomycetota bacterium]
MARWKDRAYKLRRWFLVTSIVLCIAAIITMLLPILTSFDNPPIVILEPIFSIVYLTDMLIAKQSGSILFHFEYIGYLSYFLLIWSLFFFSMWHYLRPRKDWVKKMTSNPKPMKRAILIASFFSAMLSIGIIFLLIELTNLLESEIDLTQLIYYSIFFGSFIFFWGIWAFVFYKYHTKGDQYSQLSKMTRGLFAGSATEAVVSISVFANNPHNQECYCYRGSYLSLIISMTVILWCFGPGLVFLYMREKRRQALLLPPQYCPNCEYSLFNIASDTCPECGEKINKKGPFHNGPL